MTPKQQLQLLQRQLQLEIVDIDEGLECLARVYPNAEAIVARVRDALGRCVHLLNAVDLRELCSCSGFEDDDGGLE